MALLSIRTGKGLKAKETKSTAKEKQHKGEQCQDL